MNASFLSMPLKLSRKFGISAVAVTAFASALTTSCASNEKPTEVVPSTAPPPPQAWAGKMQELSQTLSELMPLIVSKSKFNNEKNYEKIETQTRKLRTLSHSLKMGEKPGADPGLNVMTGLFDEDISRALASLGSGNREYARQVLRDTTSYCVQCHTQTSNGPEFPHLNLSLNTNELNALEQAEFFAATRQFDKSLEAFEKALSDEKLAKADPFEWEQSARSALAITVRVKKDPKQTSELLSKLEKLKSLPPASKEAITAWKKTVQEWSKDKRPAPKTREEALTRAETLIKAAQKRQEFPLDHSQDISFFRASSLIHDLLLEKERPKEFSARAYYWAGVATEATRDMSFWTLHEAYYEQCIRMLPHTKQAEQCFAKLKDSVTLGYSGSGGVKIPPEISQRLETFRVLAAAEAPKAK
jgi:cytochrome c553